MQIDVIYSPDPAVPTRTPTATPTPSATPSPTATYTPPPTDGVIHVTTVGVTYDENGESATPLPNLVVNLYAVEYAEACYGSVGSLSVYATLTTDANGEGTFNDLPRGEYCVGPATLESGTWGTSAGSLADVMLTLTPTASVTIRYYPLPTVRLNMVDDQGQPLIGNGTTTGCLTLERTDDFGAISTIAVCDADDAAGADGTITFTGGDGAYSVTNYQAPAGYALATPLTALGFYPVPVCRHISQTLSHYPYNTGTGSGITIVSGDVTITFTEVTQPGATWATLQTGGFATDMPSGYAFEDATFYHVQSTAQFTGLITMCVTYDPADYHHPETIALFVPGGDPWLDVTTTNTGTGQVCGVTDSLDSFFIAEPTTYGSVSATVLASENDTNFPDRSVSLYRIAASEGPDYCWSYDEAFVDTRPTDASGAVDFGSVPTGTYCVRLDYSYISEGFELIGSLSREVIVTEGGAATVTLRLRCHPARHRTRDLRRYRRHADRRAEFLPGAFARDRLPERLHRRRVQRRGASGPCWRVAGGLSGLVRCIRASTGLPHFAHGRRESNDRDRAAVSCARGSHDDHRYRSARSDGNPVPNACITPHGEHQYSCMNNGNGYAVLGGHYQPGQIVHLDVFVGGSSSIRQSLSFEIQPGETLVQQTVTLQPSVVIQLDPPDGYPASSPAEPEPRRFRFWIRRL